MQLYNLGPTINDTVNVNITNTFAAHNQILIGAGSDTISANACPQFFDGCRAKVYFYCEDMASWLEGESITVLNQTILVKDSPNNNELPSFFTGSTYNDFNLKLFDILSRNRYITSRYTVDIDTTVDPYQITLTAKNGGAFYNLIFDVSVGVNTTHYTTFSTPVTSIYEYQDLYEYGIYVDVFVNDDGRYNKRYSYPIAFATEIEWRNVGRLEKSVTKGNIAELDISPLMRSEVSYYNYAFNQDIASNQALFERVTTGIKLFKYRIGHYFKYTAADQRVYVLDTEVGNTVAKYWVANSAVPLNQHKTEYDNYRRYWDRDTYNTVYPLTTQPTYKPIHYEQKEYLSFMWYKSVGYNTLQMVISIIFEDGTGTTVNNFYQRQYNSSVDDSGGMITTDVSPSMLGLDAIEIANNKRIAYYSVSVYEATGVNSTFRNLVVNQKYSPQHQDRCANIVRVMWKNSLGGFDSAYFSSYAEIELSNDRKTWRKANRFADSNDVATSDPNNYNIKYLGDQFNATLESRYTYKVSSGWVNVEVSAWLRDMVTSKEVYIHSNSNTFDTFSTDNLIPVTIAKFDHSQTQYDNLYQYDIVLESSIQRNFIKR